MRKRHTMAAAALAATALVLAACGGDDNGSSSGSGSGSGSSSGKVGVILPDTKSSARWETADRSTSRRPSQRRRVDSDIQNAQGDKTQFQTIADSMITSGVNVLMIVNLDSGSGKACSRRPRPQGIATIDYDRLTLGGGADFYVSFDNTKVGQLQGEGLQKCLTDAGKTKANIAYLNGSPTDNNATLFKAGPSRRSSRRTTAATTRSSPTRPCPTGTTSRPARSSSRCTRRPAARSTASSRPTTVSATPRSPSSRRTA